MPSLQVVSLATFPVPKEPGIGHEAIDIGPEGLAGDRPKRAAVSLTGTDSSTRANIVVSAPSAELAALDGRRLRIGEVVLAVWNTGNSCTGLYAAVGHPGRLAVGDVVEIEPDEDEESD